MRKSKMESKATGLKGFWLYIAMIGAILFFFVMPFAMLNYPPLWSFWEFLYESTLGRIPHSLVWLFRIIGIT